LAERPVSQRKLDDEAIGWYFRIDAAERLASAIEGDPFIGASPVQGPRGRYITQDISIHSGRAADDGGRRVSA